jgi:protein-L-isoaspartate(D-aspartate) O-methyltransferase
VSRLEVSGWVKTENVVAGQFGDQIPSIAITLYDDQRRQLEPLFVGPFYGTSAWREEHKTFSIPKEAREGILRIGLFGATGIACFDKIEIKKVQRP